MKEIENSNNEKQTNISATYRYNGEVAQCII